MKRRLANPPPLLSRMLVLLLPIVGGAIVNVAVAWGCALQPVVNTPAETGMTCDDREGWAAKRWRTPGMELVQSMRSTLLANSPAKGGGIPLRGDPQSLMPLHGSLSPDPRYLAGERNVDDRALASSGWPCLSLWCEYDMYPLGLIVVSGGIATPITEPDYSDYYPGFRRQWQRALPLRPIWPGLAINSVFYAFILWLLFAAPFALQRWRRVKRGLCPKCAYPVGTWGGDVCTECGARHAVRRL